MTQIAITGVNNSTSWCVGQPRSRWTGTFCTIYFTIESGFRVHEFTCLLCCAVCRCIRNFCSFLWARKWITASSNPEAKVNRTCYFTEYIHTRTHSFPSFACIKRFFCYFCTNWFLLFGALRQQIIPFYGRSLSLNSHINWIQSRRTEHNWSTWRCNGREK